MHGWVEFEGADFAGVDERLRSLLVFDVDGCTTLGGLG